MTAVRVGSLFSGSGGLDMAVCEVLGGETVFVSDIDPGACKILANRYPGVPNLGDITKIDWTPWRGLIEVLTGGFPCQDVSAGGKRAGLIRGTRSGLWHEFLRAIDEVRPGLVVIENVRGLLSARGDVSEELDAAEHKVNRIDQTIRSLTEIRVRAHQRGDDDATRRLDSKTFRLMGLRDRAVVARRRAERRVVRAIGTVVGSLADIGYDTVWCGLRAADVDACHGRFRVFIAATPHPGGETVGLRPGLREGDTGRLGGRRPHHSPGKTQGHVTLFPTPRATDGTKGGPNQRGSSGDLMLPSAVMLLPTPAVNDMGEGKTVQAWDEWTAKMKAAHGNGNGASLAIEAQRLLPTPSVADSLGGHERRGGARGDELLLKGIAKAEMWGDYAPAIARWEAITRPAPAPTETGPKGSPRLSPRFTEWMMGLPDGWITDVPGITRNEALKACGNGVVPQQAEAALRWLLEASA